MVSYKPVLLDNCYPSISGDMSFIIVAIEKIHLSNNCFSLLLLFTIVKVEIDDYQNYEKALDALTEAYKCLSKAKDSSSGQHDVKLADLQHRVTLIKKFVLARR